MSLTEASKVLQGKEKFLFLTNDSNKVCSQIKGKLKFSEKQLSEWRILLEMRNLWLRNLDTLYFHLVIPNKGCVYPEYLPDDINVSEKRCIYQLMDYLSKNSSIAEVIYPLEVLLKEKSNMHVYRRGDTHWTRYGSYVVYKSLVSEINKKLKIPVVPLSEINFFEETLYQPELFDLGNKIGWQKDVTISHRMLNSNSRCTFDNKVNGTGRLYVYENSNSSLPTAILFGDSFSHGIRIFLAESFSKLTLVQQPNLDYSLIEKEKPNVVISEQVERFMIKIPDDLKGLSNSEIFARKKAKKEKNMKTHIFLTTQTSATASMSRIFKTIVGNRFEYDNFVERQNKMGKLKSWELSEIPDTGGIIHFNGPPYFNRKLELSRYQFIINYRDPRDRLCNIFHWKLVHPTSGNKSTEELAREALAQGIDNWVLNNIHTNYYDNLFYVLDRCALESRIVLSYARLCLDFDSFIAKAANFFEVELSDELLSSLEVERTEKIARNPKWIGNRWEGSDIMPGRYLRELKPETICELSKRFEPVLRKMAQYDPDYADLYLQGL